MTTRTKTFLGFILAPSLLQAQTFVVDPGTPAPASSPAPLSSDPKFLNLDKPAQKPKVTPFTFTPLSPGERASGGVGIGAGGGISEGKRLETMLWSSGGAVIGSIAGPAGTMIGAVAGAVAGLFVAIFIVPHNGPEKGNK